MVIVLASLQCCAMYNESMYVRQETTSRPAIIWHINDIHVLECRYIIPTFKYMYNHARVLYLHILAMIASITFIVAQHGTTWEAGCLQLCTLTMLKYTGKPSCT